MKILIPVTTDGLVEHRFGKAPRVAVVTANQGGTIADWTEHAVGWDVLHDQGEHGAHHARMVRFAQEHQIDMVVAAHIGAPMVNTFNKMGLPVILITDVTEALEAVVAAIRRAHDS